MEPVVCARCLFLQAIPHLRLPSKLSRQTSRRYGVPFLCASRTPLQKLCRRVRRRRSRLPLASNFSLFSCRQQLIKYRLFTTKTSCFLMCAKFFAHICTISSKLCVEPVVCARRSRILRALIAFSCRQQLQYPSFSSEFEGLSL